MLNVTDIYFAGFQGCLDAAQENSQFYDQLNPRLLCQKLEEGTASLRAGSQGEVSCELDARLTAGLEQYETLAEAYAAAWNKASEPFSRKGSMKDAVVGKGAIKGKCSCCPVLTSLAA